MFKPPNDGQDGPPTDVMKSVRTQALSSTAPAPARIAVPATTQNRGQDAPNIPVATRVLARGFRSPAVRAPASASDADGDPDPEPEPRRLKRLLKNPEAAHILGVTPGCLEKARSEKRGLGLIPTVDFGPGVRIIRYDPDVLAAHLKKQKGGK